MKGHHGGELSSAHVDEVQLAPRTQTKKIGRKEWKNIKITLAIIRNTNRSGHPADFKRCSRAIIR